MPVGAREPSEVETPEIPRRRATSKIADAYSRVNPVRHVLCLSTVVIFSVFSFIVAKEKIIANENNLGKGEARDLLL